MSRSAKKVMTRAHECRHGIGPSRPTNEAAHAVQKDKDIAEEVGNHDRVGVVRAGRNGCIDDAVAEVEEVHVPDHVSADLI